jgi:hypothetical protein
LLVGEVAPTLVLKPLVPADEQANCASPVCGSIK